MSKFHIIRARIRRISRYARLVFGSLLVRFRAEKIGKKNRMTGLEFASKKKKKRRQSVDLLSADTATWANREGLGGFFVISRKPLIAKPTFRVKLIWIFEIIHAAMSHMGAELHVSLDWKISKL